jgi:signal recognition particle subunit SRP54
MLDKLTKRLAAVVHNLRHKGTLSEADLNEMMREVRVSLLEADVNFQVAKEFIQRVKEKAIGEQVFGSLSADQTIIKIFRDELVELLGQSTKPFVWSPSPPTVVLMCGLQGSGKTTTTAKLAKWLIAQGKKPMLAACDIQRPAAIKQLEVLGESVGVPVFAKTDGTSPVQIAKEALERCKHLQNDVLIVDTAGRLSVDEALMEELKAIANVTKPTEVFLVVDSTTGQEAVNVAQAFHERVNLTGAIFTKLDGDTRGGAILSVRAATGVDVRFTGVGESVDALEVFHPTRLAERILGFGDVMGIIERAEAAIDQDEAKLLESRVKSGAWDFNDMLGQFKTMRKMGNMRSLVKMIPGLGAQIPDEAFDQMNDHNMNRMEAIILSMTPKERSNPDILNGSRRKRIAAGSGTSVEEVNQMVKGFYEMRRQMKSFSQMSAKMQKYGKRRR